ncbi:MAG: hypothetical protein WCI57_03300 [Candidatus Berkelbacteria bacterium]
MENQEKPSQIAAKSADKFYGLDKKYFWLVLKYNLFIILGILLLFYIGYFIMMAKQGTLGVLEMIVVVPFYALSSSIILSVVLLLLGFIKRPYQYISLPLLVFVFAFLYSYFSTLFVHDMTAEANSFYTLALVVPAIAAGLIARKVVLRDYLLSNSPKPNQKKVTIWIAVVTIAILALVVVQSIYSMTSLVSPLQYSNTSPLEQKYPIKKLFTKSMAIGVNYDANLESLNYMGSDGPFVIGGNFWINIDEALPYTDVYSDSYIQNHISNFMPDGTSVSQKNITLDNGVKATEVCKKAADYREQISCMVAWKIGGYRYVLSEELPNKETSDSHIISMSNIIIKNIYELGLSIESK